MAFRITEHVLRGEIDNTERGRIRARLWLDGFAEPVTLDLMGDCAPDLAGCRLTFENPAPKPAPDMLRSLRLQQTGWINECTAARKFRIPTVPISEYRGRPDQFRLEHCLWLEWFSRENFEVQFQGPMRIEVSEPAWRLSADESAAGRDAVHADSLAWMQQLHGGPLDSMYDFSDSEMAGVDQAEAWKGAQPRPTSTGYERFAARMDAEMNAPRRPAREILRRLGFEPPRPAELSDEEIPGRLWELLHALGGRRMFFHAVDHLSDRELYLKLDAWLDDEVSDLPWPTQTNITIDLCETSTGDEDGFQIWLRYYASDEDRKHFLAEGLVDALPPKETPAFPREDQLPRSWFNHEAARLEEEWADEDEDEHEASDPLGLARIDQELELERRRTEVAERTGGEFHSLGTAPPEVELAFLENVERIEAIGWKAPGDVLRARGIALVAPEQLPDDARLTAKLWELIHQLAQLGLYLERTDHLTDRELYLDLWERGLREEVILPGRRGSGMSVYDPLGSGSEEDEQIHLRYHASEAERARFAQEFPDQPLPEKAEPPARRDWRLPKPEDIF